MFRDMSNGSHELVTFSDIHFGPKIQLNELE